MLQDSLLELALFLLVVLAALYVVVRLAVEHGIRRAPADTGAASIGARPAERQTGRRVTARCGPEHVRVPAA
jgi:hypothetical protein